MLNSLITRENTGNFNHFGRLGARVVIEKALSSLGFSSEFLLNGTGNFETSTANYFAGTGNSLQVTGLHSSDCPNSAITSGSFTVRSDGLASRFFHILPHTASDPGFR
jgi:hypothetical protein